MNTLKTAANYCVSGDLTNTDNMMNNTFMEWRVADANHGNAGVRGWQDRSVSGHKILIIKANMNMISQKR